MKQIKKPHIWLRNGIWHCGHKLVICGRSLPVPVPPLFGTSRLGPSEAYADLLSAFERVHVTERLLRRQCRVDEPAIVSDDAFEESHRALMGELQRVACRFAWSLPVIVFTAIVCWWVYQ